MKALDNMIAYIVAREPLMVKRTFSAPRQRQSSSAVSICSASVWPCCSPVPEANASASAVVTSAGLLPRMLTK